MNTNNIYFAELALSTNVKYIGDLEDYFLGQGIIQETSFTKVKFVLVQMKNNIYGEATAKDLNTGRKYLCETPCKAGKLFIAKKPLIPFEVIYPGTKKNLPKRKVLKLGNEAIKEYYNAQRTHKKENNN